MIDRVRSLVIPCCFASAVCAGFLLFSAVSHEKVKATDGSERFYYRQLRYVYDSSAISGWCGEMLLYQSNVSELGLAGPAGDILDTTAAFVNTEPMTQVFTLSDSTRLRLYRAILTHTDDSLAFNYFLPDTCSWTIELCNALDGNRIVTLDSLGAYPVTSGLEYPSLFGFQPLETTLEFNLGYVHAQGIDSCYLLFKTYREGSGSPSLLFADADLDWSVSSIFHSGQPKTRGTVSHTQKDESDIGVYPNPFSSSALITLFSKNESIASIRVFDINGRLIRTIHDGRIPKGASGYPLNVGGDLKPGRYTIVVRSNDREMKQNVLCIH